MAKTTSKVMPSAAGPAPAAPLQPAAVPSSAVMPTYARHNLVFERGEGSWLMTFAGERYLDCASGVAVNALGHAHPGLIAALTEQAGKVWHTSNLYRVAGQERLAERLAALTFADKVFFCNSGAEACEGAVKLARRYQFVTGHPERYRIITFKGAFHGRTTAMLAATGNEKYLEGFGPPAPGFDQIALDALDTVERAIGKETAAIMIEPVQGEGGVRAVEHEMLRGLRALCDAHGLLLVLDEVQSGVGRTGRLFAHEASGITPDVMAVAKGLGGGFPLGAFLATDKAAQGMTAGMHGSTFGGNPLATAVGNAVLDAVTAPGFLAGVQHKSLRLRQGLARLKDLHPGMIEEVRGVGLLAGIRLKPPAGDVVKAAIEEKLLTVAAGDNVLRILPPLNIPDDDLAEAVERLSRALARVARPAS